MLLVALLPACAQAQADEIEAWGRACAAVFIPNELKLAHSSNTASAFREAVCKSASSTTEGSGGFEFIEVISAGGGGKTVTKEQFCRDTTLIATTHTITNFWSRSVPDLARREFGDCMARFRPNSGLPSAVRVSQGQQTGDGVVVTAGWDKNVAGEQPLFDGLETYNVTCPSPPWKVGALIGEPTDFICRWGPDKREGVVVVKTQNRGSGYVNLTRSVNPLGEAKLILTTQEDTVERNETRCGPTVQTPNLHNNRLFCLRNPPPYPLACENGWSMAYIDLSLEMPAGLPQADHAVVESSLHIDCVNDRDGACGWNAVGNRSRFKVIRHDAQSVVVRRTFGSHAIGVRLCASFPVRTKVAVEREAETFVLQGGTGGHTFRVRVPTGSTGMLKVKWADGATESFSVGSETGRLALAPSTRLSPNPSDEPNAKVYTYQVKWSQ